MIFYKTGNLPICTANIDLKKDNNAEKLSFKGQPADNSHEIKKSKVTSPLATAYLNIDTSKNIKPLTAEELKNEHWISRFGENVRGAIRLARKYPHSRELFYMKKSDDTLRFDYSDLETLAAFYEEKDNRNAVKELAKMETSKGEPRFDAAEIIKHARYGIYDRYSYSIKELASIENSKNEPVFEYDQIKDLMMPYRSYADEIKELAALKNEKGEPIDFTGKTIFNIVESYGDHKNTIVKLCTKRDFSANLNKNVIEAYEQYPKFFDKVCTIKKNPDSDEFEYSTDDIVHMGDACNINPGEFFKLYEMKEQNEITPEVFKTIIEKVDEKSWMALDNPEFKEYFFENIDKIKSCQTYSSDNFVSIDVGDKKLNIKLDSENGFEIVGEETDEEITDKNPTAATRRPDGKVVHESFYLDSDLEGVGCIEKVRDEEGNLISLEVTKPSKRNPGVLIITRNNYDKDGNFIESKRIGTVENFGEKGERRKITREYTSPLGVKTKQLVLEVPRGKRSCYEIDDKKFERVFKIKDENTTETYAWGNKYETKFNEDNIEVTVTRKRGKPETVRLDNKQIDFKLLPLLKQIPGDFLYTIYRSRTNVSSAKEWDEGMQQNASFVALNNTIYISDKFKNDPFTFAHEYGHMVDSLLLFDLNEDSILKAIVNKELDAYKKSASSKNEECIGYFVSNENTENGKYFDEIIAEATALLSGLQHDDNEFLLRAKILQENFPETIAYIGKKIEGVMR